MNEQEKQIIYSLLVRLIDNGETLTRLERRDLLNQLCQANCDMALDDFLRATKNQRKIKIKRGTTSENDKYTGVAGDLTLDTDAKTIRIHDGETLGGISIARTTDTVGDWVVETQLPTAENNYIWYRKYKSGWVEMGGKSNTQTITLPVEMADTNYHIYLTGYCNTTNNNVDVWGWRNKTTTSFVTQGNTVNNKGESSTANTQLKLWSVFGVAS